MLISFLWSVVTPYYRYLVNGCTLCLAATFFLHGRTYTPIQVSCGALTLSLQGAIQKGEGLRYCHLMNKAVFCRYYVIWHIWFWLFFSLFSREVFSFTCVFFNVGPLKALQVCPHKNYVTRPFNIMSALEFVRRKLLDPVYFLALWR